MKSSAASVRISSESAKAFRSRLLGFYRRQARRLPWRQSRDPYAIWVSEVMLQQTTVASVLPHYERFLERFPSVQALAASSEEDVLSAWSGLGYYHRARNLLRGASKLVELHGGVFPRSLDSALSIPGVGLYTASAVLSIAYGVPLPVVDGNVRRVLARVFALAGPTWRTDAAYYNLADELLDRSQPGDFNQALMELGATVCSSRTPACPVCPLRGECRARERSAVEEFPEPKKRRPSVEVTVAAALIEEEGRLLFVRRGEGRLLSRMWEIPQTSLESSGPEDLVQELRARHGLEVVRGELAVTARHAITYRRIRLLGYRARLRRPPKGDPECFRWASPEEADGMAVSSLTRKIVRGVTQASLPLEWK